MAYFRSCVRKCPTPEYDAEPSIRNSEHSAFLHDKLLELSNLAAQAVQVMGLSCGADAGNGSSSVNSAIRARLSQQLGDEDDGSAIAVEPEQLQATIISEATLDPGFQDETQDLTHIGK